MSAICGLRHRNDAPLDQDSFASMMKALNAFGPDGSNQWKDKGIALGFQALHITPESTKETLPTWSSDLQLAIVADARIDNRAELAPQLGLPANAPDSVFILHAYHKWGEDCPPFLIGDFAFAIWDARKRQLFCARDIMGIRPFYYQETKGRFVFASDCEGLFAAGVPREPDVEFIAAHLRNHCNYPHRTRTCYDSVFALPAASSLTVRNRTAQTRTYWSPDHVPSLGNCSEADCVAEVQRLLTRAVTDRLRCFHPVGAHFSGGLDSSAVAVIAHRELKKQGRYLTAGYSWSPQPDKEAPVGEEQERIERISSREGIPVEFASVTELDCVNAHFNVPDLKYTSDWPEEWAVRRQASNAGVRLLLSGWGGDELIAQQGHGYHAELLGKGQMLTLLRLLRRTSRGRASLRYFLHDSLAPWLPARLLQLISPQDLSDTYWPTRRVPRLLKHEFRDRLQSARALQDRLLRLQPGVRKNQLLYLENGHLTRRTETWAAVGGRRGISYAYPLLDQRVIEFALKLPSRLFFKNGWNRHFFRKSAEAWLAPEICWNPSKSESGLTRRRQDLHRQLREAWAHLLNEIQDLDVPYRLLDAATARTTSHRGLGFVMRIEWSFNPRLRQSGATRIEKIRRAQNA